MPYRANREEHDVTSELKLLNQSFQVSEVWDGRRTAADLMHFRASNGSGGSMAFHSALMAMGRGQGRPLTWPPAEATARQP
jgi:hypothetical protein